MCFNTQAGRVAHSYVVSLMRVASESKSKSVLAYGKMGTLRRINEAQGKEGEEGLVRERSYGGVRKKEDFRFFDILCKSSPKCNVIFTQAYSPGSQEFQFVCA